MKLIVEGVITSIEQLSKMGTDNKMKNYTQILLAQDGIKEQVTVRLPDHCADKYCKFEVNTFEGRLMTWTTRNGIGSMVMVND